MTKENLSFSFKSFVKSPLILTVMMIQKCCCVLQISLLGFLSPSARFIHSKWREARSNMICLVTSQTYINCSLDIESLQMSLLGLNTGSEKSLQKSWTAHFKCLWFTCSSFLYFCSNSWDGRLQSALGIPSPTIQVTCQATNNRGFLHFRALTRKPINKKHSQRHKPLLIKITEEQKHTLRCVHL